MVLVSTRDREKLQEAVAVALRFESCRYTPRGPCLLLTDGKMGRALSALSLTSTTKINAELCLRPMILAVLLDLLALFSSWTVAVHRGGSR